MNGSGVGAILGLLGALGLLLVIGRLPYRRRLLAPRVEGYLGNPTSMPSSAGAGSRTTASAFLTRAVASGAGWLDQLVGGHGSVRRRLDQLGAGSTEEFRIAQLTWGSAALAGALSLGLLRAVAGSPVDPPVLAILTVASGAAGALARDRALTRAVARRNSAMLAEFPAVADLLALSVTAGEGPLGALERVAGVCNGELAGELRRTLADTRAGTPLVSALEALADRAGVAVIRRFVDGLIIAIERGTPLADVLRAQAADVREASRHALIEVAARKEVAMMVPAVIGKIPC